MNTKIILKGFLFLLFNCFCFEILADSLNKKSLIVPPPFELNGIYYQIFDTDKTEVEVSFAKNYFPQVNWYSIYSGTINIPSTITYEGTSYTVSRIGEQAFSGQTNMTTVIIPNTVECIDVKAFLGCTNLRNVIFAANSNLKSIERQAFGFQDVTGGSCTSLQSITFPNSLTYIGEQAFCHCTSLKSISGGSSLETIDNQAFQDCKMLTEVTLSAKRIGKAAFWNCERLQTVNLNSGVELIDERAFLECKDLTDVQLPNTLTMIGAQAFRFCQQLASIEIPNSVADMGDQVFYQCSNLETVSLSESLTRIPPQTFEQTSLVSIDIPNSVKSIGANAFNLCIYLETVNWGTSITHIYAQAFEGDVSLSISTLPEKLKYIGDYAFNSCESITEITIPSSTEQIMDGAFYGCINLGNVYCLLDTPPNTSYTRFPFENCNCPVVHVYNGKRNNYEQCYDWGEAISQNIISLIDDIPLQKAESISINNAPYNCAVNEMGQATATILPANVASHELSWSSSDPNILYINEFTGEFFGQANGVVTITATATDGSGVSASALVYVGQQEVGTTGDVNGDGKINGLDIVEMVDIIMNQPSDPSLVTSFDLNADGNINGMDLVELVDLVMSQTVSSAKSRKAPERLNSNMNSAMTMSKTNDGEVSFGFNSSDSFILSQFTLELSEGVQLTDIISSDRRHVVAYQPIDERHYAVLCYSTRNAPFADGNDMLRICYEGSGTIKVSDVMLVDTERKPLWVNGGTFNEATGINIVNENLEKPSDIYSISGILIQKNATSLIGLKKGTYVINGKKIQIK